MRYCYKCTDIKCEARNVEVIIDLPIEEAGTSQKCEKCNESLQKIYGNTVIPSGEDKTKY